MFFRARSRSRSEKPLRNPDSVADQPGEIEKGEMQDGCKAPKRRKARKRPSWLWQGICSALIISGLSYYALERQDRTLVPDVETTGALVSPPPAWDPVVSPAIMFAFDMPELDLPNMVVEARDYRQGGREDMISIGAANDPFYLRIALNRSQSQHNGSFYIDLARNAARAGLSVRRNARTTEIATKFGSFEAAQAVLASDSDTRCLAFRGKAIDGKMSMHGWLCGEERFVADDMLACFLDRLTATPALRERELETELRALDKRRTPACDSAMERIASR